MSDARVRFVLVPFLLLAGCAQPQTSAPPDPYANGMDYPWAYTLPPGTLAPLSLTPGENTLSYEPFLSASNGWGPVERDRSNGEQEAGDGRPLTLNGTTYSRGFGTHAGSDLRFSLRGTGAMCTRFTADIGVDDEVGSRGSVVFQVYLDGAKAYDSGTMTGASVTKRVNLDITGKRELRLAVTDAGNGKSYDHADWAQPKIFCTKPLTVIAWGDNLYGQTAVPGGLTGVKAVSAGTYHSLALKSDGTVVAWGNSGYGQATVPGGLSGVKAVAAGGLHSLALKNDGAVVAWGSNDEGQTTVPAELTSVKGIAAGDQHSLAVKNDGTVVGWGYNLDGQATIPVGLTNVQAVAAGALHSLALRNDGTVVAWGSNGAGQTAVPGGLTGVKAIAAGWTHSVALKMDGTVVAWGSNAYGQTTIPAGLTNVKAIAAGFGHTLALKNDGTVRAWGFNGSGEATVPPGLTGVTAIAGGGAHSLAVAPTP